MKAKNHPAAPKMIKRNMNPIHKTNFLRSKVPPLSPLSTRGRHKGSSNAKSELTLCLCFFVPLSLKLSASADSGSNHFLDTETLIYYRIGEMSNP